MQYLLLMDSLPTASVKGNCNFLIVNLRHTIQYIYAYIIRILQYLQHEENALTILNGDAEICFQ